jgi:hypothetical protein
MIAVTVRASMARFVTSHQFSMELRDSTPSVGL